MSIISFVLLFNNDLFQKKKNNKNDSLNISNIIFNHVNDSHEWKFIKKNKINISIPLPIIIWNNGLEFFLSYDLMNGKTVKGKNGYYIMFRENIYQTNSLGKLYFDNKGNTINDKPLDFSITKNTISTFISFILLIFFLTKMGKNYNYSLTKENNICKLWILVEYIILFIRDEVAIPYIGKNTYKKYLSFLLSSFFFILVNNLMGIIPGFPNVTGNINTTLVLATITFFITILNSKKSFWKHIFWMPGVPIGIKILLAPIELIGIFIRPLTLCIRLFANILAGHIIVLSFICLIFIFKNIFIIGFSVIFGFFISLLEVMVAFLQSFIFTTLSALIIGNSIKKYKIH
ncbi:F0F1 ATP synthase subunit A [Blattabacterium cuenoti]|uniref:F0F1 ATP synthase subunit A n=1 Tax=Blattabacterium cuenoti TaxID=1653831 RepID=UPI00293B955B|nr:F0F1 ATP synthase subunit A [Blattabacterium cuenoti]